MRITGTGKTRQATSDKYTGRIGLATSQFGQGAGFTTLRNTSGQADRIKRIDIDARPSEVTLRRDGDDLLLRLLGDRQDQLRVDGYFHDDGRSFLAVDDLRFSDDSHMDVRQVRQAVLQADGSDELLRGFGSADRIVGGAGGDQLFGEGGNDWLEGQGGHDLLVGGAGDDFLLGGSGDDILEGGAGRDRLSGGRGDDTYHFHPGDGHDVIFNMDDAAGSGDDRLMIGAGVDGDQVWFDRVGANLRLRLMASDDSVVVAGWYAQPHGATRLDSIRFGDGTCYQAQQVDALVQAMARLPAAAAAGQAWSPAAHEVLDRVLAMPLS